MRRRFVGLVAAAVLAGCASEPPVTTTEPPPTTPPATVQQPTVPATPTPTTRPTPPPTPTKPPRPPRAEPLPDDPRWVFFSADERRHRSPWFPDAHRVMIGFGCTPAPYYSPDPGCPDGQGFHHGIDVALPCGTPLRSGVAGTVLDPSAPGTPGGAYGEQPFRIRTTLDGVGEVDVLVAHARAVSVAPGDDVRQGQQVALASDSGAPDGCHLHLEVRPAGGGYDTAIDPAGVLALRPVATVGG